MKVIAALAILMFAGSTHAQNKPPYDPCGGLPPSACSPLNPPPEPLPTPLYPPTTPQVPAPKPGALMKMKIAVLAAERTMIVAALMQYGATALAKRIAATQDPAADGPEVAILRERRSA